MSLARKLLRNFVILFGGNVVGQLTYFIGLLYLARALGPKDFGIWNFSQAFVLYLLRAGDPGLEIIGIRESSKHPDETSHWITSVVFTRFVLAIILMGVAGAVIVAGILPITSIPLVAIFSLALLPTAVVLEWVYESHQEVQYVSYARMLKGVLFTGFVLVFLKVGPPPQMAAIGFVVSITVPILLLSWRALARFRWGKFRDALPQIPRLLSEGWPIGLSSLSAQYCWFLGTLIGGYILSGEQLGYYTAGHRVVIFLWGYVVVSSSRVLLPPLSRMFRSSSSKFIEFVERFFRLATLGSVPLGFVGIVISPIIFQLLLGEQYANGVEVFQILIVALVVAIIRSIFEVSLLSSERQHAYLVGMGLLAMVYTIATPLLMIIDGVTGAAWASLIAEIAFLGYLIASISGLDRKLVLKHLFKPAVGILPGVLLTFLAGTLPLLAILLMGIVAYLGILILWRGIGREDFRMLRDILSLQKLEMS